MKIGIDIDNVISNSHPAYIDRFNQNFELDIQINEISEFYYFWRGKKIDDRKAEEYIQSLLIDQKFQMSFEPVDLAQETISKWRKIGHSIHYITARPDNLRDITLKWLDKHGFLTKGVSLDLFPADSSYPTDVEYKKDIVEKLKIDILIEDAKEIAEAIEIPVVLIDRQWNQGDLSKNVIRVGNWAEVEKIVSNFGIISSRWLS